MKRIRINIGKAGLVFRNGNYIQVLNEGTHWIGTFDSVIIQNLSDQFSVPMELNIALRDEALANMLTVIKVEDGEVAFLYEEGNFKRVLAPGRYAYWKGVVEYTYTRVDLKNPVIDESITAAQLQERAVLPYVRTYAVEVNEKGLLYVDGKFVKAVETGVYNFWKNAVPVVLLKADMRTQQLEISGQEILTQDKAAVRINFNAQYRVTDLEKALVDNRDVEKQLYTLIQLALREFVGTLTLDELLDNKESVSAYVLNKMAEKTGRLGIELKDCGVRDIILPGEVKEIMNQVLVAQKKAQANIVMRREETASTRSLLNTAKLMEENEMLYKLKEMEYVEKIADKINSISLSGGTLVMDQLKDIFSPKR